MILKGNVAIVTGGGIGKGIATELSKAAPIKAREHISSRHPIGTVGDAKTPQYYLRAATPHSLPAPK